MASSGDDRDRRFGASFPVRDRRHQPIIDDIYGRGSQFAFWFAASGVVMALALLANGRMIDRLGSRRLAVGISVAFVLVGIAGSSRSAGGALLAAVVAARIEDTVTPMVVGSLAFGLIGLALLVWAGGPAGRRAVIA